MNRVLSIDRAECTDCESCLSLCPSVFRRNHETGLIEIRDQTVYPEEDVRLAMCMCPGHCILLEET